MKFGRLKDGRAYAAQFTPSLGRVAIIDTDADLFNLMERQGFVSKEEDSDEIFGDIFPADNPSYQESQGHIST